MVDLTSKRAFLAAPGPRLRLWLPLFVLSGCSSATPAASTHHAATQPSATTESTDVHLELSNDADDDAFTCTVEGLPGLFQGAEARAVTASGTTHREACATAAARLRRDEEGANTIARIGSVDGVHVGSCLRAIPTRVRRPHPPRRFVPASARRSAS